MECLSPSRPVFDVIIRLIFSCPSPFPKGKQEAAPGAIWLSEKPVQKWPSRQRPPVRGKVVILQQTNLSPAGCQSPKSSFSMHVRTSAKISWGNTTFKPRHLSSVSAALSKGLISIMEVTEWDHVLSKLYGASLCPTVTRRCKWDIKQNVF